MPLKVIYSKGKAGWLLMTDRESRFEVTQNVNEKKLYNDVSSTSISTAAL